MPRRKKEDEIAMADRKGPPRGAANARERTRYAIRITIFRQGQWSRGRCTVRAFIS
jgi:hypothetical protein